MVDDIDMSWRETIRPLFQHYTERTPGSFIEEKDMNLTWHYRNADPEFGSWQAAELQVNLDKILSHMAVSVRARQREREGGRRRFVWHLDSFFGRSCWGRKRSKCARRRWKSRLWRAPFCSVRARLPINSSLR